MRARASTILATGGVLVAIAAGAPAATGRTASAAATPVQVYRVGSWHGIAGNQPSIEAAVAALHPGDWVLIGPGDWHPRADYSQLKATYPAAVLVTSANTHVRGMNRNRVVIDGTRPGAPQCSANPADQDFGPIVQGKHRGRNGTEALKTDGVNFENFTVCNFMAGTADSGNEIWWNGGDDSGHVGLGPWYGQYLTATSTSASMANNQEMNAKYGLFVSNAHGPGVMDHTYASNFSDSSYYIGACPNCNATIDHGHAENSALGYSGTNSGGHLTVQNSEWDNNKTGFVSNSQNSADPPSPQNGACPAGATGPTGTDSCWIFRNNYVHDNNNPNVPQIGEAALGPVGGGVVLAGDRNNIVSGNRFVNNDSWAILTTFFPDTSAANPNNVSDCAGGVAGSSVGGQPVPCFYSDWGNEVANNTFTHNGAYANPTNGDIADLTYTPPEQPGAPGNCFHGNTNTSGTLSTWPMTLQTTQGMCGNPAGYPDPASLAVLGAEAACASQALGSCPTLPLANYPRQTKLVLQPLVAQTTMPDPCAGVPVNPWCPQAAPTGTAGQSAAPAAAGNTAQSAEPAPTRSAGSLAATGLPLGLPVLAAVLLGLAAVLFAGRSLRGRR